MASTKSPTPVLAFVTAVVLTLIWGTTWAAIRISLDGFPPLKGLAIRFALASAILFVVAWRSGVRFGRSRHEKPLWVVQAIFGFSLAFGLIYWAEQWVPSGLTSLLFSTLPLFVVFFAYVLIPGERLTALGLLGMAVGFAGVAVIFSEDLAVLGGAQVRYASVFVLVAVFVVSFSEVAVKKWGAEVSALSLTAPPMAAGAVMLWTLASVVERDRPISLEPAPVAALLYLAVVGSAVAFGLFFWLLKHVSVIQMSLITYGIPVVAVLIGAVFLDEPFTMRMLLGGVLVLGGATMVMRPGKP